MEWLHDVPKEIKKAVRIGVALFLAVLLVFNPFNSSLLTSVGNQEFFTAHVRDIFNNIGVNSGGQEDEAYYLATGAYERDLEKGNYQHLYGSGEGQNLIVIQVEALQNFVIGREYDGQAITPNLNALIQDTGTVYFENYYQQLGSGNTSDAEFATNNGFMGAIESFTYRLYEDNYFYGLPQILKDKGYSTAVFHGYDKEFWNREAAYPGQGFDLFVNSDDFVSDNLIGMGNGRYLGISDHEFFRQSMPFLTSMEEPFYSFMVTLSSHHPFHVPEQLQEIKLLAEDKDTLFGNYIQSASYADGAIGDFIEDLKEEGLYDNSVIAIYGDHSGIPQTDKEAAARTGAFIGEDREYDMADMMNIPLIIHVGGGEFSETVAAAGGQTDFLPTIAYLMGFETLDTIYTGQNLFTADRGFVPQQTYMLKGSFIDDEIVFEMSRDGVFTNSKAWDKKTGKPRDIEPYRDDYLKAKGIVELGNYYLRNDVVKGFAQGLSIEEIQQGAAGVEGVKWIALAGAPAGTGRTGTAESTLEGIDRSYDSGFKDILVRMAPVDEEDIDLLDEGEAEGNLDASNASADPADPAEDTEEVDDSARKLHYKDILKWLGEHKDARLFVLIDEDDSAASWRVIRADTDAGKVMRQIVPVVTTMEMHTMVQYEGFVDILFMPAYEMYSPPELAAFIELSNPWGVALSMEAIGNGWTKMMPKDVNLIAYYVDGIDARTSLRSYNIDGYITTSMQPLRLP